MDNFNKNDKQHHFNVIKGVLIEMNDAEKFCSITIKVGHENTREVNFSVRKEKFDQLSKIVSLLDKVCVKYFIVSRKKFDRYFTSANLLDISAEI